MADIQFVADQNAKAIIDKINSNTESSETAFINGRRGKQIAKLTVELEALGEIMKNEYGYSVLVKFINETDRQAFDDVEQTAINLMPTEVEFKSMIKDEKMFLKLTTKDDKFKAKIDPPVIPSKLETSPIQRGSTLQVTFQPNLWIKADTKTGGLFLTIYDIVVDGGKKKRQRSKS